MGPGNRLRISNDIFLTLFMLTLVPAAISGMLAVAMFYLARSAGNRQWLHTDVSAELWIFGVTGGLSAVILAVRLFAPITWVDLREDRRSGRPAWLEGGRSLPNSESEPERGFGSGTDDSAVGGMIFTPVGIALILLVVAMCRGLRFAQRGLTLWGWEFGFFHLFGRDWTGSELAFMSSLIVLLIAVCRAGWRRERDLNR